MITLCQRSHIQSDCCKHRNTPHSRVWLRHEPLLPGTCTASHLGAVENVHICPFVFTMVFWSPERSKKLNYLDLALKVVLPQSVLDVVMMARAKLVMRQSYWKWIFPVKKTQGVIYAWFTYCYNAQALFWYPLTNLGRTLVVRGRVDTKLKITHAKVVLAEMMINEESKITTQAFVINRKGTLIL